MRKKIVIPKEDFIKEVKFFKEKKQRKLKELLNNQETLKEFLSNHIIHDYLTRDSHQIGFEENHPKLYDRSNKNEENTDHYELKTYQYTKTFLPYRSEATTTEYYLLGTDDKHVEPIFKNINNNLDDIYIDKPTDISQIRERLDVYSYEDICLTYGIIKPYNKEKIRFLLTPNYKDTHATTLIHILNPDTKQPIVSLFLNSFSSKNYFEYIKERFNLYKERMIYGKCKIELEKKIPMGLKNKSNELWIDEQNKTAVLIKPSSKTNKNKELLRLKENKTIERSFEYATDERLYFHLEPIPLIDVSHHLQIEEDENCVLYGLNFIQGITKMLSDEQYAKKVYDLALQIKEGHVETENSIKQIFQNDLKAYLHCYYDEKNKATKSSEEIKNFHLKQRWEIGNQVLDILYPIEKTEDSIHKGLKNF